MVWMKEWVTQKNKRLWDMESPELRFGWHTFLWYNKVKISADFKNHIVRFAMPFVVFGINTKKSFFSKISLWVSTQEAFSRKEMTMNS